jgi:dTDP-4-amino-4,6-dideoxy-D-galactose acyltransferase
MHDLRRLDWDSEFFGLGVGSVHGELSVEDLEGLREFAQDRGLSCVYWFADVDEAPSARLAQEAGFRYVDTRLTFERKLDETFETSAVTATQADIEAMTLLARTSHSNTRFFFDGNFDTTRCEDLYQLWLERSFERVIADTVLVVHADGKAAGYVTVKVSGDVGQIGLIAVADFAQGRGLGKELVNGAMQFVVDAGASTMRVATQSRNLGAQRLYVSCGFKPAQVTDIYHAWF